ncbi:MAG: carbonic anhydrase [Anaerolineae bacterium]
MPTNISPTEALQRLVDGNKRYVAGSYLRPHQSPARRIEVAETQHPFSVILGCSDSRVPPELVFDQGLGDLYVIRVAGHVPDEAVIASLAHAVEHLGIHLLMVLGHQNCGAVRAAVEGDPGGHLAHLVQAIQPAVKKVKFQPSAMVENAVRMHTMLTVQALRTAQPILAKFLKEGQLTVVGAYYDLSHGNVTLLE